MSYSEGFITVPGKGKRYRDKDGNYFKEAPYFGLQTIREVFQGSGPKGPMGAINGSVFGRDGQEAAAKRKGKDRRKMPNLPADYKETELAAGQAAEDFRKGAGFPGQTPTRTEPAREQLTGRDSRRGGATGTQMSPKGADFAAFQKTLENDYGVNFNFDQGRGGMQSVSLPNTGGNVPDTSKGNIVRVTNGQNEGNYVKVDNPDFDKIIRGEIAGGFSGSQGGQAGSSNAADNGSQALMPGITSERLGKALGDTDSLRFDPSKYKADPDRPQDIYETADVGLDRRSRAFLDYKGDDSLMALRNAEAAQRTIKQNGKVYAMGADGEYSPLSDEGAAALKADRNAVASQDFLDKYKETITTPADAQSPDSGMPVESSRENFMQQADRTMPGTLFVPGEKNNAETFSSNVSAITGDPAQFNLKNSNYFTDTPSEEPEKSWLPTEDEFNEREELMKGYY